MAGVPGAVGPRSPDAGIRPAWGGDRHPDADDETWAVKLRALREAVARRAAREASESAKIFV
jgi:hypothetical protein